MSSLHTFLNLIRLKYLFPNNLNSQIYKKKIIKIKKYNVFSNISIIRIYLCTCILWYICLYTIFFGGGGTSGIYCYIYLDSETPAEI